MRRVQCKHLPWLDSINRRQSMTQDPIGRGTDATLANFAAGMDSDDSGDSPDKRSTICSGYSDFDGKGP
jgi:hypothetical protein